MQMTTFHIARYAVLAVLLLFSLIELGIGANLTNISRSFGFTVDFVGLCVAVAVLTLITVIPVVAIDFFRQGAFTSLVVFELAWAGVLTVLWIAAAADTSSTLGPSQNCGLLAGAALSDCQQLLALEAFAWLNFILLFGWLIALSVSAAIAHNNGNPKVWTSPVSDTQFFAKSFSTNQPAAGFASGGYPPQQNTGTQQAYPISPQRPYGG